MLASLVAPVVSSSAHKQITATPIRRITAKTSTADRSCVSDDETAKILAAMTGVVVVIASTSVGFGPVY